MRADDRLTLKARADLIDIWDFGADRWGPEQADDYEDGLRALIGLIADNPNMARERPELQEGVRVYPYRSHIIAFRVHRDGIAILCVFRARSDWQTALTR